MTDPFNLARFVAAQAGPFDTVCAELAAGRKRTHWMWYVFPQLAGLGRSEKARFHGLSGEAEAAAYEAHPVLGPRLRQCVALVLRHEGVPPEEIMGSVDALKLRSCATLFERVAAVPAPFGDLLAVFYGGARCDGTLALLGEAA